MFPTITPRPIFDSTLDLLLKLTKISSPSGHLEGLTTSARCFGEALEQRGLAVEIRTEPDGAGREQPVLYARGPRARDRHLFLIGHLDTVLTAAEPRREGGKLWATGAVDMKGGLAALVGALDLLAARGQQPPEDLLVVVVPDEEVAGHLSLRAVEELGPSARGLWVLEPGVSRGDAETVVIGRRGMFQWRLDVAGTGAHAGNAYWQGRSALDAAAEWCLAARELAAPGSGPTVNAGRLLAGDTEFLDDFAAAAELVGTPKQLNVVPDRALAEGEARFLMAEDGERLPREMERLATEIAARREVEAGFRVVERIRPLEPHAASRTWANAAVRHAGSAGWKLEIEEDRGGISFPNFLPDGVEIPILDGLGPVGGGMHTRQEFVSLESLDRRITLLAELLSEAAGGVSP